MKAASIRDLHIRTSELVREVAEGAVIVIERPLSRSRRGGWQR
jgi:antitoxin (DNA-binding transcriptional repressor) of toxin-antitoxin stability system